MNKYLLLMIFSFLLYPGRGRSDKAQELLNSLDLEEIVEKLTEYDINQDGQLSEMEVELQQPEIQKYLDRYEELLKAEQKEEEEEEAEENTHKKEAENSQKTVEETERPHDTQSQTPKARQQQESSEQQNQDKQKDTVTPPSPSSKTPQKQGIAQKAAAEDAVPEAVEDEDDGVEIEVVEEMEFVEDDETPNQTGFIVPAIITGVVMGILTLFYVLGTKVQAARQAHQRQREGELHVNRKQGNELVDGNE